MRGSSAESLARLRERLADKVSGGFGSRLVEKVSRGKLRLGRASEEEAAAGDAASGPGQPDTSLGNDLFAAAGVLREQVALRRAATDPSAPATAKSRLLEGVFSSHLGEPATELVAEAGSLRWAASRDLPDALEQLAVEALVRVADAAGEGDRLEDELFAFGRDVAETPELRVALADPARSVADKQALVRDLLQDRATPGALRLAQQAVAGHHRTVAAALDGYTKAVAAARERLVAYVRVARPLTDTDHDRLAELLARDYGGPVHLNVIVDPSVIGGVRVQVGDEVLDGTVATRLDDARRRLVGVGGS